MQMRVLIVTTKFPHFSETFIFDHVSALIENGIDVLVFSHQKPNIFFEKNKSVMGDRAHTPVKTIYYKDLTKRIPATPIPRILFYLKQMSWAAISNPQNFRDSFKQFYKTGTFPFQPLYLLNAISPPNGFDAIHCHFCTNSLLALKIFGPHFSKGKLITTVHGYDLTKIIKEEGCSVYKELFRHGKLFLPVNEKFRKKLIQYGVKPGKVILHHVGVDTDSIKFKPRIYSNDDQKFKILSVGRLVEKKGFDYSINAVSKMPPNEDHCVYNIIGEGPERQRLEKIIHHLGLQDRVKLLGSQPREEVGRLMADSHVLVAPSVTARDGDQEGIPVVLMEAMATGLPVISTRHSGIPELIEDGKSGFLVPEGDAKSICSRIQYVRDHSESLAGLCRNARRTVETDFNEHIQYRRLIGFYDQLLTGSLRN
jgi:colanic acid/amylovoran biosynthesis glycosyltransferase